MRVLVCGGRNYDDLGHIWNTLNEIDKERGPITCVIHGAAKGADLGGKDWAKRNGRQYADFPAAWHDISHPDAVVKIGRHGMAYDAMAGHRRNQQMLDEGRPQLVIAFPGGPGTRDMVARAKKAKAAGMNIDIIEVEDR